MMIDLKASRKTLNLCPMQPEACSLPLDLANIIGAYVCHIFLFPSATGLALGLA